jgi:2-phosphoglycerate kinase
MLFGMSVVPKIILIGGPQATGKTTLAKELSARLNIPWISTDQIRTICGITPKGKEVLSEEIENNEEIWKGVERFIKSPFPWEAVIVEGVAVLPHLVAQLEFRVSPVFIIDIDEKKIAETIYQRSLLPWIQTKTEEQQRKKVAYIVEFNNFIKKEAQKYNFPLVGVSKSNQDIEKILELLG